MDSDKLYRIQKKDLPKLEAMLYSCFADDPLYVTLIPDAEIRKKLMPELFKCDMDEFYETCEIFADSEEINGILVVSDEAEPYDIFQYSLSEAKALLQTDACLIKEDPSFKTLCNFVLGEDYLNSSWTDELNQDQRIHIIYLAVDPKMQHHGIAAHLVNEAIKYADEHKLMLSLETHNKNNVEFYEQLGFSLYKVVKKNFPLEQFCMIREAQ